MEVTLTSNLWKWRVSLLVNTRKANLKITTWQTVLKNLKPVENLRFYLKPLKFSVHFLRRLNSAKTSKIAVICCLKSSYCLLKLRVTTKTSCWTRSGKKALVIIRVNKFSMIKMRILNIKLKIRLQLSSKILNVPIQWKSSWEKQTWFLQQVIVSSNNSSST